MLDVTATSGSRQTVETQKEKLVRFAIYETEEHLFHLQIMLSKMIDSGDGGDKGSLLVMRGAVIRLLQLNGAVMGANGDVNFSLRELQKDVEGFYPDSLLSTH